MPLDIPRMTWEREHSKWALKTGWRRASESQGAGWAEDCREARKGAFRTLDRAREWRDVRKHLPMSEAPRKPHPRPGIKWRCRGTEADCERVGVARAVSRAGKRALKLVDGTHWKSEIWEATLAAATRHTGMAAVTQSTCWFHHLLYILFNRRQTIGTSAVTKRILISALEALWKTIRRSFQACNFTGWQNKEKALLSDSA